jgi:acetyl-CoA carboxylase biotin carboxylase subunit
MPDAACAAPLRSSSIGGIETTIPLHRRIIGEQAFIDGDYDIHWLEKLVGLKK